MRSMVEGAAVTRQCFGSLAFSPLREKVAKPDEGVLRD